MRLDLFLVEKGYYKSRELAKEALSKGKVSVDGKIVTKPSYSINNATVVCENVLEFVSRGGLKLKKAIEEFLLDFEDKTIVDIGSSTGGFTDCALQKGAKKVYAIDIGTDQLDEKMLNDDRVYSLEQTNFLDLPPFPEVIDYYVADVSFISIKRILFHLKELNAMNIVILIKPQFEVEGSKLNKNGVLKNRSDHLSVLEDVRDYINNLGYRIHKLTPSPIKGKSGNIEYLAYIKQKSNSNIDLYEVVKKAFEVE